MGTDLFVLRRDRPAAPGGVLPHRGASLWSCVRTPHGSGQMLAATRTMNGRPLFERAEAEKICHSPNHGGRLTEKIVELHRPSLSKEESVMQDI